MSRYFGVVVHLFRDERIPVAVLRRREVKWLEMLENWEKWMSKRFRKVCYGCHHPVRRSPISSDLGNKYVSYLEVH